MGHQAGQAALLTGYFAAGSKPAFAQRSRMPGAMSAATKARASFGSVLLTGIAVE